MKLRRWFLPSSLARAWGPGVPVGGSGFRLFLVGIWARSPPRPVSTIVTVTIAVAPSAVPGVVVVVMGPTPRTPLVTTASFALARAIGAARIGVPPAAAVAIAAGGGRRVVRRRR